MRGDITVYSVNTNLMMQKISDEINKIMYKARVADINDSEIFIEVPINEFTQQAEAPAIGTSLRVWFQAPDGARASFDTKIIGRAKDNIAMLIIAKPEAKDIYKKQQRSFVRVPAYLEAAIEITNARGKYSIICRTDDISGGGFSVKFKQDIKVSMAEEGVAWIVIPRKNKQIVHAHAYVEVIRTQYPEDPHHLAWASFKFKNIQENERSKIIQYTFERQIELYG